MPTNKQRREAARRHLERQLQQRQEREARQKKVTLITSIVATLVLIGVVVAVVVAVSGDDKKSTKSVAGKSSTAAVSPSPSASASTLPAALPPAACLKPGKSATTVFDGVTVKDGTNLKKAPQVTSKLTKEPTALECQDLVVGKGAAATPTSTVNVQYAGVLYKDGTAFDSSWANGGKPVSFPLTGVVPGFTEGIGGTGKVAPMKVGGRRILILPAVLGYGTQASGKIPAGSSLVFIVDLTSVTAAGSSSSAAG